MESFYTKWLQQFAKKTQPHVIRGGADSSEEIVQPQVSLNHPSEIVYENESMKMIVEKAGFKRQKVFCLQDHLFNFKIVQKKQGESLPQIENLFDFLHAALLHILESIKTFYNAEDHNVAYLTLHQDPMVNGLNTGFLNGFVHLQFCLEVSYNTLS